MVEQFDRANLVPPIRLVFLMWAVFSVERYFGWDFGFLGILPRTTEGLVGVLFAPMIHGNVTHLVSNTFPVLFLGSTLYLFYPAIAARVFLQCYLFTNFFVWLFARPFIHIGASGLVYALAFFLIFLGIFKRDFKALLIAVVIAGAYGGLVYNVTAINNDISWESHLLGGIVGVVNAYTIGKFNQRK